MNLPPKDKTEAISIIDVMCADKRLCSACGVLGDERHVIYECSLIDRNGVILNDSLNNLWYQPDIFKIIPFVHFVYTAVI